MGDRKEDVQKTAVTFPWIFKFNVVLKKSEKGGGGDPPWTQTIGPFILNFCFSLDFVIKHSNLKSFNKAGQIIFVYRSKLEAPEIEPKSEQL